MHTQTWQNATPFARGAPADATLTDAPRLPSLALDKVRLSYAAGEVIYVEGDLRQSLYAVLSGAVRTVRHTIDGRRQIGGFYYRGDIFGLEDGDEHGFTAEAICATEVTTHRLSASSTANSADPILVAAAMGELCRVRGHLAMLGRRCAGEKMASFLIDLARRSDSDGASLPMSRQDIADYLGLALETVSRVLSQLQSEGLVSFATCRDFRIIRGAALKRLAES